MNDYDLIVIGGGSGGIGAALSGARAGLSVLLIEKTDQLGGTVVRAGVSCWEMGAGGTGIPFDIYRRLKMHRDAVGVYSIGRHMLWPSPDEERPFPGGESVIDPDQSYINTLRRCGAKSMAADEEFVRKHWHGVIMEPSIYAQVVEEMLEETGQCEVLKNSRVVNGETDGLKLRAVTCADGKDYSAPIYVDATGGAEVAAQAGCRRLIGQESRDAFGEPDAAHQPNDHLNAASLIYRVTPQQKAAREKGSGKKCRECWWRDQYRVAAINHLPGGDLSINMLPTISGRAVIEMGPKAAYDECRRRVRAHWQHLQKAYPEFQLYRLAWIAPEIGVRETFRIVAQYMLTEHDLLAGLSGQEHEDVIAIADHAMDTHGSTAERSGCGEMVEPYGVPYGCLLPRSITNLLVASRGSGFSSLAASSCRLSRTMMQLGQAAGNAAGIATDTGCELKEVPVQTLRSRLRDQYVQLEWPLREDLAEYICGHEEKDT